MHERQESPPMETHSADNDVARPHAPDPPRASSTVSRARWWTHLALITVYLGILAAVGWSRDAGRAPALSGHAGQLLLVGTLELALFACVFGLAWLASRASRDDLLLRWRGGLWTVPLGIGYSVALRLSLAVVGLTVAIALVATHVTTIESLGRLLTVHAPRVEALLDVSAMRSDPLYYWLTITFISFVVAGLREELWRAAFLAGLRALWPRWFTSRAGQIAAVAVAAVVFGLGHAAWDRSPCAWPVFWGSDSA
jgi:hypothetical protein